MKMQSRLAAKINRFDWNPVYGPFIGIARATRWKRAKAFDLKPGKELAEEEATGTPQEKDIIFTK